MTTAELLAAVDAMLSGDHVAGCAVADAMEAAGLHASAAVRVRAFFGEPILPLDDLMMGRLPRNPEVRDLAAALLRQPPRLDVRTVFPLHDSHDSQGAAEPRLVRAGTVLHVDDAAVPQMEVAVDCLVHERDSPAMPATLTGRKQPVILIW